MRFIRSIAAWSCVAAITAGGAAHADPARPASLRRATIGLPRHTQRARDRFDRTWAFGASVGVGSPRGFAGAFVELRPWRALGVSVGGGAGGAFGPSVDVSVFLAPVGGTSWAIGAEGAFSHQFSYGKALSMPDGRAMPAGSNWLSAGLAVEFRPQRGMLVRVGAGRAWLMNTSAFGVLRANELAYAEANFNDALPGVTPLDAARAALAGETLSVWYVHVDIAPSWRW